MLNFLKNSRGEILNLLFKDADKGYYLREIAKILGKEPSYIQSSLNNFIKEGVLVDERKGNLRFFKLNKKHLLYEELKKIISKTIGLESEMSRLINSLEGVEYAFIFGSIAKNKENINSDIDVLLVGDIDPDALINGINSLEEKLAREINYHIYNKQEIIKKLKDKDFFITKIFNGPKILLKGNLNELTRFN